jgi:alkylation response protein AidB-like acyl-CoA dehydrogenase
VSATFREGRPLERKGSQVLADEELAFVATVTEFVDKQVKPVVREPEHANSYPTQFIDTIKEIGIFGQAIPKPYGFGQVSMRCYVSVTEELARGWMSLAGAMGGHTVVAKLIGMFGTAEQKERYLPPMATGNCARRWH